MMITKKIHSLMVLITLGAIWGTGYSIAHFAMTHGVTPLGYSFWQSIGPAIIISILTYLYVKPNYITYNHILYYTASGLTGIVIPNTIMYFSAAHLPASILAIVVNTVPIIAYPLALITNLERFNAQRFFGILIALAGLMLIIVPKASLPDESMSYWAIMTLLTPCSFAVCSIIIAKFKPAKSHILELTSGMLITSSILLAPLVLLSGNFYFFHSPLTIADGVIITEIILSSIGYVLFFKLITQAGPVYYSLVDTIVVITGIIWGYFLFDEHLNIWTGSAVLLIIIALWLVTKNQRESI